MVRIIGSIGVFVASFGFYLVLAGTLDAVEIGAGLVCATAASGLAFGLARVATRGFAFAPPSKALARPLAALLPETILVGRTLLDVAWRGADRQRGDFILQPFEPGDEDRTSRGRRALCVLGISLAPRTFVIRGEADDVLLLHSLPTKPPSSDRRWPA